MKQTNKKFIFFYIVIVYVFAFLFWWTYLLYKKNNEHFEDVAEIILLKNDLTEKDLPTNSEYIQLEEEFERDKTMIITEGIVFFLILVFGMVKLGRSFAKEIEIARQQRNFILSITHELKSPISSIKLMNETLLKRDLEESMKNKLMNNSLTEVSRLESLVENILLAAKIENNKYGFSEEKQNLTQIVKNVIAKIELTNSIPIKSEIEENIYLNGDKSALISIILNVIENALKYAPNSAFVEVTLKRVKEHIVFEVKDLGNGIAEEEKEKVFNKFYRIGNEDTRQAKGTGLGLYIVKKLVEFHEGEINIADNQPKGTHFAIRF